MDGGLHPRDIAVMIGSPNVDDPIESPSILFPVIGNVRGEICCHPIRFDQDTVLFVTIAGAQEPGGTVALVDKIPPPQSLDRPGHQIFGI